MTGERCFKCNKVVLPPIKCKCGNISCLTHRFEKHGCTFDIKTFDKNVLEKSLPKMEDNRVVKI